MTQAPYILGFSDSVHDRSVCLYRGAEPIVAIEEERLTREKHSLDFKGISPLDADVFSKLHLEQGHTDGLSRRLQTAADYCLRSAGITMGDVALVIGNSLHSAMPFQERALYLNHHLAHGAGAFFGSGETSAAVLVVDGFGDATSHDTYEATTLLHGKGNRLLTKLKVEGKLDGLHLTNSAGIFYRIGTVLSGFAVIDEGKTMGLSAYGKPRFARDLRMKVRFHDRGVDIDNEGIWQWMLRHVPERTDLEVRADIAASFQSVLEDIMLAYARIARQLTSESVLCLAGGVALNCVANQKLIEESGFRDVFIFPAAADNGISLGAAGYAAHGIYGLERRPRLEHAFFGRSYDKHECRAALDCSTSQLSIRAVSTSEASDQAADALARGEIIMWFQGGAEIGPRALGHRSILADPRNIHTRDYINASVKSREGFRPLAPMVLDACAGEWFEVTAPSPFMLTSPRARENARLQAPATVHVDGSARLQTVSRRVNPEIYDLISAFMTRTGVPIILNTSFNVRGEPIVETPEDAVRAFDCSPVNHLFLDGWIATKKGVQP